MLLIPCPWCGEREETEFRCGGEAHPIAAEFALERFASRRLVDEHGAARGCRTMLAPGCPSNWRAENGQDADQID